MNENEPTKTTAEDLMLEQLAPGEEYRPIDPKRDDSYQNAREHMAETFAHAAIEKQRKEQELFDYLKEMLLAAGLYIVLLLFFFVLEVFAGAPKALQLLACLAPLLTGMGLRLVKEQLSLREAVSACKVHIIATAGVMVYGIIRLIFSQNA